MLFGDWEVTSQLGFKAMSLLGTAWGGHLPPMLLPVLGLGVKD